MPETQPQIGFVATENTTGFYKRVGCGNCPKDCGFSHAADKKYPDVVDLQVCGLPDKERLKNVWCGALAMNQPNLLRQV